MSSKNVRTASGCFMSINVTLLIFHLCITFIKTESADFESNAPFWFQVAKEIIERCITRADLLKPEKQIEESALLECGVWPYPLPSVTEFRSGATMATIKQHGALLGYLLLKLSAAINRIPAKLNCDVASPDSPVSSLLSMTKQAVLVFLERASVSDWMFRRKWAQCLVQESLGNAAAAAHIRSLIESVCEMALLSFPAKQLAALREGSQIALDEREGQSLQEQPMNPAANPQWADRVCRRVCSEHGELSVEQQPMAVFRNMEQLFRAMFLLMRFAQQRHGGYRNLEDDSRKELTGSKSFTEIGLRWSPLMVSRAIHDGQIATDGTSLPHPVITHIWPFFERLDDALVAHLNQSASLSQMSVEQILEALQWRKRFWNICSIKKCKKGLQVSLLQLHWHWLENKMLKGIFKSVEDTPPVFRTVARRMSDLLGSDSSLLQMLRKMAFWLGPPLPYESFQIADVVCNLNRLCADMAVAINDRHAMQKLSHLLSEEGYKVRRLLLAALKDASKNPEWAANALVEAEKVLREEGYFESKSRTEEEDPEPRSNISTSATEVKVQLFSHYIKSERVYV